MDEPHRNASTDELALHERLLADDPTAPADCFERYIEPVTRVLLGWRQRGPDTHIFEDAAIDAVASYVRRPQQYDPARLPLERYLIMAARGDLTNALKKEQRRGLHIVPADDLTPPVELQLAQRNESVEEQVLKGLIVELPGGLTAEQALRSLLDLFPDPTDRRLLLLHLDQERKTEPYAQILGLSHLADAEQRKVVKRHKDRIKKRLERLRARLGLEGEASA